VVDWESDGFSGLIADLISVELVGFDNSYYDDTFMETTLNYVITANISCDRYEYIVLLLKVKSEYFNNKHQGVKVIIYIFIYTGWL
jgi:hypothetical protein